MEELVWQFIERVRDGEEDVPLLDLLCDYPDLAVWVDLEISIIRQTKEYLEDKLSSRVEYRELAEEQIVRVNEELNRVQQVFTNFRSMS